MYPWLILFALVAFPVAEALSIIWLSDQIGWWTLAWLAAAFFGGLALIRFERLAFAPRMLFSMQRGDSPFRALFTSTHLFMAGGLLMFPGLITDVMALALLLYPGTWKRPPIARPAANDEILEGEFRREPEASPENLPRRDI
jgi:UPF0716 protein FxsA